eukprot:CAMPEP_0171192810 /NCGR_PEP_ID=MMETSP0790-20130122/20059_1 /TAXON_ID=2925 /ORGANISM="Alexandrium catenella, Strain OF101" /LENGTH=114 /DNA_ID=CAMNT_0011657975 /DNA_START=109 /DNA_END=453 /DNA_ORIENTATION=-
MARQKHLVRLRGKGGECLKHEFLRCICILCLPERPDAVHFRGLRALPSPFPCLGVKAATGNWTATSALVTGGEGDGLWTPTLSAFLQRQPPRATRVLNARCTNSTPPLLADSPL